MSRARPRWMVALAILVAVAFWVTLRYRSGGSDRGAAGAPSASASSGRAAARLRPKLRAGGYRGIDLAEGVVEPAREGALGAFSGRVLSSADRRPVPDAELTFVGPEAARVAKTDAEGRFRLEPERAGLYELLGIAKSGFLPFSAELGASPVTLVAKPGSGIGQITLLLDPAVEYRGRVVDPKGAPVEGASIRVVGGDDLEMGSEAFESKLSTDTRGEFSFRAPDGAIVEARKVGFGPGRARVDASVQLSRRLVVKLAPLREEDTHRIRGRVVGDDGEPRGDVAVVAKLEPENPAAEIGRLPERARSGSDGAFELGGLAPGKYSLLASDGVSAPASLRGVPTDGSPLVLVLASGASLSGRVIDQDSGQPLVAFSVILFERHGPLSLAAVRALTVFDADGRYVLDRIRPGRYVVTFGAKGYAPGFDRELEIQGETRADAALGRGASLHGVVRDEKTHAPIEGAKVSLEGRAPGGEATTALLALSVSDGAGRFELTGLAPGERSIFAAAAGHHARVLGGFSVQGREAIGPVEIELAPTASDEEPRIELVGIGAVLGAKDDALVIGKLVDGGGAAEARLAVGDGILAVDGVSVIGLGFEGAIQRIRGPEGSSVLLLVRGGDGGVPREVLVRRRRIKA